MYRNHDLKSKKLSVSIFVIPLIILGFLFSLYPFLWIISYSFKTNLEVVNKIDPRFLPKRLNLDTYKMVVTEIPFFRWFLNSVIVAVPSLLITLFTSSLAGYVFAKFRFRMKNFLFMMVLATLMIPFQVVMIPNYLILNSLHLINSLWGLIIPGMVTGFGIFLCRQFASDIPQSFLDASRIDGAGEFRIYWSVILPQLRTSLTALGIFVFMAKWNDYQWPLIVINNESKMTLPLGIAFFASARSSLYNAQMAMAVLIMIPLIILFLVFQKHFIQGFITSGMK